MSAQTDRDRTAAVPTGGSIPDGDTPAQDNPSDTPDRDSPSGGIPEARPAPGPVPIPPAHRLRADFTDHLTAHYPRLVGQLFAITLDAGEAHDLVQDAYSRAWRDWARIRAEEDAAAWVRRVAVRSSTRGWRQVVVRLGLRRPALPDQETIDPRTAATLRSLGTLPTAERRALVLVHMAGMPVEEVAAFERTTVGTVRARLSRASAVLAAGMVDLAFDGPAGFGGADGGGTS